MNTYIGVDLGTSSLKGLLVREDGEVLKEASAAYDVRYPQPGWTEQSPEDWKTALLFVLESLTSGGAGKTVRGISFGGQMHGLVALDKSGRVIRPCILWNDGRTEEETAYLNDVIGKKTLLGCTGNIAFAGFTAPKLLWLRKHEPENFAKIDKILLPKDYLAYLLSGVFATDFSDASGTLLLDVKNKRWSRKMLDVCQISEHCLPEPKESFAAVSTVLPWAQDRFGFSPDVKIVIGAGDNAAAAVGTGTVNNGDCSVSVGTSGTIFICSDRFGTDEKGSLHSFAHANGKWHRMGCILSAASCRKWWLEEILESDDYASDERKCAAADSGEVLFLPYLSGERCPHNDVNVRGAFLGLSHTTTRAEMSRAVMEGVAFAIRDCLEIAKQGGVCPESVSLCGGGARSATWRQIFADVLNLPIRIPKTEQGPAYGAAILAMVGCGAYASVEDAAKRVTGEKQVILPSEDSVSRLEEKYRRFAKFYPAIKGI